MRLSLALLAVSALPASSFAKPAIHFVDPQSLAFLSSFPLPPAAGSPADQADLAEIHRLQDTRTQAECARAKSREIPGYEVFFGSISPLPEPLPPDAAAFFDEVGVDADAADKIIKKRFQRPRPPLRDETLSPCVALPSGFSYPSFHATESRLFALILSDLVPARRDEFMARADEAALDRNLGGVHFPTDSEAGKLIADELYPEFKKSPAFAAALARVRAELKP